MDFLCMNWRFMGEFDICLGGDCEFGEDMMGSERTS